MPEMRKADADRQRDLSGVLGRDGRVFLNQQVSPPRLRMVAYLGWWRDTEVEVSPKDLGCGAGEVTCFECGGDGDWTKFYPEPETLREPLKCIECKGTGKVLISI